MTTHSFIKGAAILTIAGLVSKLFGALYRIPFFRVVGPEGMGLYQMAYPLYTTLLAVSSAGIPVAVSKLVSENLARRDFPAVARVFKITLIFIAIVSGIASFLLYKGAFYLADHVLHDKRAYYSIAAIAPAVFFVGIMSVFRGYFQGFQEMVPTACSQVMEQIVRVVTVLAGAAVFLPQGVEYAAAAATFGAVTGAAAGTLFLMGLFFLRPYLGVIPAGSAGPAGRRHSRGVFEILHRVVVLALPISIGGLVMPVMQTLDAITVPGRLQLAGYSVSRAVQLYGELTGGAVTLINLPTVITISLAASLVPAVSGSLERGNYREIGRQAEAAVEITVLVGLPAAVGLAVLATPISDLLFKCPEAGLPLAYLAPAAFFLGLHQTGAGILQGMGKTFLPVLSLVLGATVKFMANYFLTALPQIGIIGAAVGTVVGFALSSYLNFAFLRKLAGWVPNYRTLLLKPATAVTIMAAGVYLSYHWLRIIMGGSWSTVASIVIGALLYFLALAALGGFRHMPIPGPSLLIRRILRIR